MACLAFGALGDFVRCRFTAPSRAAAVQMPSEVADAALLTCLCRGAILPQASQNIIHSSRPPRKWQEPESSSFVTPRHAASMHRSIATSYRFPRVRNGARRSGRSTPYWPFDCPTLHGCIDRGGRIRIVEKSEHQAHRLAVDHRERGRRTGLDRGDCGLALRAHLEIPEPRPKEFRLFGGFVIRLGAVLERLAGPADEENRC